MLVTKFNEVSCAFLDVFLDPAIAYTLNVGSAPTALFFDRGSPVEWGATAARGVPGLVAAVEARVPPLLSPPLRGASHPFGRSRYVFRGRLLTGRSRLYGHRSKRDTVLS